MTKLSQQLTVNGNTEDEEDEGINEIISSNPVYNISVPGLQSSQTSLDLNSNSPGKEPAEGLNGHVSGEDQSRGEELELRQQIDEDEDEEDEVEIPREGKQEVLLKNQHEITQQQQRRDARKSLEEDPSSGMRDPGYSDPEKSFIQSQSDMNANRINGDKYNPGLINMVEFEKGPHREMAVDVPENFIARSKTPPRYPPNKSQVSSKKKLSSTGQNGSLPKPVPPPRDTVISDRTKPLPPARTSGTPTKGKPQPQPRTTSPASDYTLTEEQKDRLKRIKDSDTKKHEEEEFLRTSLRGSEKLQKLKQAPPNQVPGSPGQTRSRVSGVVNPIFQLDEPDPAHELLKLVGVGELLGSLQRIQQHITTLTPQKLGGVHLNAVDTLLRKPEFTQIINIHNLVQQTWCINTPPTPVTADVQQIAQEVVHGVGGCALPEAVELIEILTGYNMEGLLAAHDGIGARLPTLSHVSPDEELIDRASKYTENSVKIVRIEKTNEPLGATVRNEGEAVIVGRIVRGGAADKSGLLHEGDELLEVNNTELRGMSINEVCDLLATMTGTLTFLVVPSQHEHEVPLPPPTRHEKVMHVKAHFDYHPDEDMYIPCQELGLSFQKGDILHIISQEDRNWWQAYREGEEDQTLAGLVPSLAFQQQREAMKQTIVEEPVNHEKAKHNKFLCAKKNTKKKKKKALFPAVTEDLNLEADEIVTYEEVALYYPRANLKRPVVLIGPPNIGRHELRQKLMEGDVERFAAAVPHTSRVRKDNETDGQDYHFISKTEFTNDIVARKFVEHGEFEKAYYGSSLDAIRAVINGGKICVLNLHPQSLKILKQSDLKPFIVFIAPPNLEILRRNRAKAGVNAKDDDLKDIIEKAREMEAAYGHYFDLTLINSDIDRTYNQLLHHINLQDREPQWVPAMWLHDGS